MCDIALLNLFTGFRFIEAQNLKWEYVDLENGIIRLPGDAREEMGDFDGTKNHHDHGIALSSYVWELLRRCHEERGSLNPYVFPSVNNGEIPKPVCRNVRIFDRITALIGTHYSPHTSRRTFASTADDAGLGFLTLKRMLNHKYKGDVTSGYIVRGFNPEKDRKNFEKVCSYILERRAEYLGEKKRNDRGFSHDVALQKLKRYALELGLDLGEVVEVVQREKVEAA